MDNGYYVFIVFFDVMRDVINKIIIMSKKRKYEEHREFKLQWEEEFFFIERN
jgi:hypothetical protein